MDSAGDAVTNHMIHQLAREEQRRQRLETRASVTVSLSATGATILFAALAYGQDRTDKEPLTTHEEYVVFAALIVLCLAALVSLYALLPRFQSIPNPRGLAHYLEEGAFRQSKDYADRRLAETTLAELSSVVFGNSRIAIALVIGQTLEFVGLMLIALATALVLS